MHHIGAFIDSDGVRHNLDGDDFTRIIALLTDGTAITYEGFGVRDAGIPRVPYNLGNPLGGVEVQGDHYLREFQNGTVELFMGSGDYPMPFDFRVTQGGSVIHDLDFPSIDR
jgi:hypothetical protein